MITIFSLQAVAYCGSFLLAFLKEPHGRWDAWLIWNMHARFLSRSGDAWREVFSLPMEWSHWDYPLLLPLSIVRSWRYTGAESNYVPAAFAFLFALLTVGLLLFAVRSLKNLSGGLLAAMILLATPFFILMGISQFADIPLAFFILATLVSLLLTGQSGFGSSGTLLVAGVSAGLCAWTKNEGLLFFLLVLLLLPATTAALKGWREGAARGALFLAGALPVLFVVLLFKLQLAPGNDLTTGFDLRGGAALAKMTDPGRWLTILKNFFITGFNFTGGPVDLRVGMKLNLPAVSILLPAAWLFLVGRDRQNRLGTGVAASILAAMLAGYFAVYLLTPLPLEYHLATSLNRLYLQLWPSFILVCFAAANAPDAALGKSCPAENGPAEGRAATPKRRKK